MNGPRLWLAHAAAVSLLLTAACGGPTSPGDALPRLSTMLRTVDTQVAHRQYVAAQHTLATLTQTTERGRATGKLSDAEANRILAAVARLSAALPRQHAPATTPPSSTVTREHGDEDKKDDKGDGHDSQNGPDDGHGN